MCPVEPAKLNVLFALPAWRAQPPLFTARLEADSTRCSCLAVLCATLSVRLWGRVPYLKIVEGLVARQRVILHDGEPVPPQDLVQDRMTREHSTDTRMNVCARRHAAHGILGSHTRSLAALHGHVRHFAWRRAAAAAKQWPRGIVIGVGTWAPSAWAQCHATRSLRRSLDCSRALFCLPSSLTVESIILTIQPWQELSCW